MVEAEDLQALTSSLAIWQAYDPAAHVDLFSSAVTLGERLYLIDPVALAPAARLELEARGKLCGVFLTNANHLRAAEDFAEDGAMILCSAATASAHIAREPIAIFPHDRIGDSIEAIAIEGAAEGELALFIREDGGTMIVGDALIHFEPNGFSFLPAKYCADQKLMRQSLHQLLDFSFDRLLFAHGEPMLSGARAQLERLLSTR
jgi:glyoxylase-like metal-dependent hydrolase (beta-lactamase superfamily II)